MNEEINRKHTWHSYSCFKVDTESCVFSHWSQYIFVWIVLWLVFNTWDEPCNGLLRLKRVVVCEQICERNGYKWQVRKYTKFKIINTSGCCSIYLDTEAWRNATYDVKTSKKIPRFWLQPLFWSDGNRRKSRKDHT